MRILLALGCLLLLVGCSTPTPGDGGNGATTPSCQRHGDNGLCGIGPQGKQNKR